MTDLIIVIEHDPDDGCVGCPLAWRDVNVRRSVHVYCDGEYRPRHVEARRMGNAHLGPRRVSRHPAPGWCPLRNARVVVQRPGEIDTESQKD